MTQSIANIGGRSKVTIACEGCRRRRARCEGTQPCDYCKLHELDCVYVRQRQRRGPRPRTQQTFNPASIQQVPATTAADNDETTGTSSDPVRAPPSPLREPAIPELPIPQLWREDVESCLKDAESVLTADQPAVSTGLVCHLIELFFSHVHVQQTTLLLAEDFFQSLKDGTCPPALCFAMCSTSVHYLVHRSTMSLRDMASDYLFALKARRCLDHDDQRPLIHRVQSHCVLALHEMHQANGLKAWVELASAKAILNIIQASPQYPPGDAKGLELASNFLRMVELTLLLGNIALSPGSEDHVAWANTPDTVETHLMGLLELQVRTQRFATRPHQPSEPPHWHPSSMFRTLQSELDRFLLEYPDEICSTRPFLDRGLDEGCVTRIQCSLTWHCCVMLLNRVFLPVRAISSHGSQTVGDDQVPSADKRSYPNAPVHFLAERKNVCFASASCVATICNEFMLQGTFLPTPLMGYSCYQSSLILLEQLHESQEADRTDAMTHLQICFALLGAMRKFYRPVESWIDTILSVAFEPKAPSAADLSDDLFCHYFARFPHVIEAAMIPLLTGKRTAPRLTSMRSRSSEESNAGIPVPPTTLSGTKKNAWLDVYQDSLRESIAACNTAPNDDDASEVPTAPKTTPRALQQDNGSLSLTDHPGSTDNESVLLGSTVEPLRVVNGGQPGLINAPRVQHDADLSCVAPQYPSAGREMLDEPDELGFQELPWPVPLQYDFCDDLDIEAMLSQRLFNGEAWTDAHVAAQMAAYQGQWADGTIDDLG